MNTVLVVERLVGALFCPQIETVIVKLSTIFVAKKATSEDTTALFLGGNTKKSNFK